MALFAYVSKIFLLTSACKMVALMILVAILLGDYNHPAVRCLTSPHSKAMETYCLVHSTFILQNTTEVAAYPGVDTMRKSAQPVHSQRYYFWLPYVVAVQVILLGLPRHLWNVLEEAFLEKLLGQEVHKIRKISSVSFYLVATRSNYRVRAIKFLACELIGVIIVWINLFITHSYLEGRLTAELPSILSNIFSLNALDTRFDEIFPKVAKCRLLLFGSSGSLVQRDAICLLPRNLLAGRLLTFLFVIFSVVFVLQIFALIVRITQFSSSKLQVQLLMNKLPRSDGKTNPKEDLLFVMKFSDFGDWLLLYHLSCTSNNLQELLENMKKSIITQIHVPKTLQGNQEIQLTSTQ